jgi:hypothetical protein
MLLHLYPQEVYDNLVYFPEQVKKPKLWQYILSALFTSCLIAFIFHIFNRIHHPFHAFCLAFGLCLAIIFVDFFIVDLFFSKYNIVYQKAHIEPYSKPAIRQHIKHTLCLLLVGICISLAVSLLIFCLQQV